MQQSITKSYLAALLMAIIVGFSYLATKLGLRDGNPIEILAHRFTFALLGLIILFIFGFFRFKLEKGDFLKILPLSLLNPILFFGLQILGVARVATSEAGIIQASTPILTMILASFFLKEKTNNLQKFFVFLSLFGVVYISLMKPMSGNPGSLLGVFLLFLSSLSNAINLVFIRKLVPKYGFQKITSIVIFSGFVFFNGLYLANKIIQGEVST
ncbi:MAG: DMT family transporter, partial [Clostridium sp.]|nr:DMT family transporter [Clostridium sp.]